MGTTTTITTTTAMKKNPKRILVWMVTMKTRMLIVMAFRSLWLNSNHGKVGTTKIWMEPFLTGMTIGMMLFTRSIPTMVMMARNTFPIIVITPMRISILIIPTRPTVRIVIIIILVITTLTMVDPTQYGRCPNR